jgi:hypothetical protein
VHRFPVIGWNHLDRIPWTTVQECTIRSFADALLAADAKIGINLNSSEWRMILIGYPEHARFDWAILDAGRRAGATSTAIGGNRKDARSLLARCLTVAL